MILPLIYLFIVQLFAVDGDLFHTSESDFNPVEVYGSNINWFAPFHSGGGYCSEALSFLKALDKVGVKNFTITHHGDSVNRNFVQKQDETEKKLLSKYEVLLKSVGYPRISICHSEPGAWYAPEPNYHTSRCPSTYPYSNGKLSYYKIGRTMFETDRLPKGWTARLNYMDELWVPTEHMKSIFLRSKIPKEKIFVVEEAVDTDFFRPMPKHSIHHERYELHSLRKIPDNIFILLFVGKFEARKGLDLLLEAYFQEFRKPWDQVLLIIVTNAYHSSNQFDRMINQILLQRNITRDLSSPNILILSDVHPLAMPVLYSYANVLVIPSHGEGWGRPHMEAMSCGTPVIATNWSGPTAFMNDRNGYLLEIEPNLIPAT
jgi:glycosyltransferase involved in cell wall biosynthesis